MKQLAVPLIHIDLSLMKLVKERIMKFLKKTMNTLIRLIRKPKVEFVSLVKKAANQTGFDSVKVYYEDGTHFLAKSYNEIENINVIKSLFINLIQEKGTNMRFEKIVAKDEATFEIAKSMIEDYEISETEPFTLIAKGEAVALEGVESTVIETPNGLTLHVVKEIVAKEEPAVEAVEEPATEVAEAEPVAKTEGLDEVMTLIKSLAQTVQESNASLTSKIEAMQASVETIEKNASLQKEELLAEVKTLKTEVDGTIAEIKESVEIVAKSNEEVTKHAKMLEEEASTLKRSAAPKPVRAVSETSVIDPEKAKRLGIKL